MKRINTHIDPDYIIAADTLLMCRSEAENISIPAGLGIRRIGKAAFSSCAKTATRIELPEGVRSVARDAFSGCRRLQRIVLPRSASCDGIYRMDSFPLIDMTLTGEEYDRLRSNSGLAQDGSLWPKDISFLPQASFFPDSVRAFQSGMPGIRNAQWLFFDPPPKDIGPFSLPDRPLYADMSEKTPWVCFTGKKDFRNVTEESIFMERIRTDRAWNLDPEEEMFLDRELKKKTFFGLSNLIHTLIVGAVPAGDGMYRVTFRLKNSWIYKPSGVRIRYQGGYRYIYRRHYFTFPIKGSVFVQSGPVYDAQGPAGPKESEVVYGKYQLLGIL